MYHKKSSWHSLLYFFIFLFFCCTSLKCLGRLFKRPFESSHVFEQRFEQQLNTPLSSPVSLRDTNDVFLGDLLKEHLLLFELGQFRATIVWSQPDGCLHAFSAYYLFSLLLIPPSYSRTYIHTRPCKKIFPIFLEISLCTYVIQFWNSRVFLLCVPLRT